MHPRLVLTVVQSTFLFTSESVGEGHPDKIWYVSFLLYWSTGKLSSFGNLLGDKMSAVSAAQ